LLSFFRFIETPGSGAILDAAGATRIIRDDPMAEQKKTRRQTLEEFVAKKPDDAFSRYGLAMECMNSGDPSAADQHFRALLERNADYIPAYLMYGQLLARESRTSEAKQILSSGMAAAAKKGDQHARSEMETLLNELS
jgi:thioredoxin-like negative regulator of GroEL